MKLAVEIAPGAYGPGDTVRGSVVVRSGGRARELTISLVYRERSPDYSHPAVEVPGGVLHAGDLRTGQRLDFAIVMPSDALPAQRLPHGTVRWEVAAKCDKPGFDAYVFAPVDEPQAPPAEPQRAATDGSGRPLVDPAWVEKQRG